MLATNVPLKIISQDNYCDSYRTMTNNMRPFVDGVLYNYSD